MIFIFSCADIELPNEQARLDILKIHSGPITKHGDIGTSLLMHHSHFVLGVLTKRSAHDSRFTIVWITIL